MTPICDREEEVVAAAIDGQIDSSQTEHLKQCATCREAVAISAAFRTDEPRTHDAAAHNYLRDVIWTKALFALRRKEKRRRQVGLALGVLSGVIVGSLVGTFIAPSGVEMSLIRLDSILQRAATLLWPTALILAAIAFALYRILTENPVQRSR